MSPKAVGDRALRLSDRGEQRGGVLCLPWDSFRVSNDCLKIEQVFESGKMGLLKTQSCGAKYSMAVA